MPTYLNTSQRSVCHGNTQFKFNIPTETNFFIDEKLYPQLKLISEEPMYSPVMNSEDLSGSGEYILKYPDTSVNIRIVSYDPVSIIQVNKDTPKIAVPSNEPLSLRTVNKIKYITLVSGHVNIEEWAPMNFRY